MACNLRLDPYRRGGDAAVQKDYELITGGAGFIGTNLADRLAAEGKQVGILDNFSHAGAEFNFEWLKWKHGSKIHLFRGDIREPSFVEHAAEGARSIYHLAAQVLAAKSFEDPVHDFEVNARGTLNLLEAARKSMIRRGSAPSVLFASTSKVTGGLENMSVTWRNHRYEPIEEGLRLKGIGEEHGVEFSSLYGCSKGAADQYVLEYARSFGVPTVVFRLSCVYGPHQWGNENQGWVAHFVKESLARRTITFYGDGRQVRDVLYVDDLVDAMLIARREIERLSGMAFNIGGGPEHTTSLVELTQLIGAIQERVPKVVVEPWRPSDPRYYVSNISKFRNLTGWTPRTGVCEGVTKLNSWFTRKEIDIQSTSSYV